MAVDICHRWKSQKVGAEPKEQEERVLLYYPAETDGRMMAELIMTTSMPVEISAEEVR